MIARVRLFLAPGPIALTVRAFHFALTEFPCQLIHFPCRKTGFEVGPGKHETVCASSGPVLLGRQAFATHTPLTVPPYLGERVSWSPKKTERGAERRKR